MKVRIITDGKRFYPQWRGVLTLWRWKYWRTGAWVDNASLVYSFDSQERAMNFLIQRTRKTADGLRVTWQGEI